MIILLKESPRDWILVGIVGLLAVANNLPEQWMDFLHIDRRFLLGGLICFVVVALIRYLKFALLLTVILLAVGANLPEEIAQEFGIDTRIVLVGMIAMIAVGFSNKLLKLPTGLEETGRAKTVHGAAALFSAILKGRIAVVQSLINQGVNVNVRTISGKTPLMAACYKGYSDIVHLLLESGADVNGKDSTGDTAMKIAARGGYSRIVDLLKKSGAREDAAKMEPPEQSGPNTQPGAAA